MPISNIILASASPRRRQLLNQIGLEFSIQPSKLDETQAPVLPPAELTEYLAVHKARAVAMGNPDAIIIAADTLVVYENQILGKPGGEPQAIAMLNQINGRQIEVITGYCVYQFNRDQKEVGVIKTQVWMKQLTQPEIDAYVRTGEALDKAGGFAIQGKGAILVEKINGDYYNIVGLPLTPLIDSLKKFGVHVLN